MSSVASKSVVRQALKAITRASGRPRRAFLAPFSSPQYGRFSPSLVRISAFTTSQSTCEALMPGDPESLSAESTQATSSIRPTEPTPIDEDTYRELSDDYMEKVWEKAEQVQESREDVEVEYSAGVLTITHPPNGTYVINKQPPNKQIWLSSPISGPKRYDWVVAGEGMHEKEGCGSGDWVYLRDGTSLTAVLNSELDLKITRHGGPA